MTSLAAPTCSRVPAGHGRRGMALSIAALMTIVAVLSPQLTWESDLRRTSLGLFVAAYAAAGVAYLAAVQSVTDARPISLFRLVAVGAVVRLAMLASVPILESDYHRYFWDGALVAN